MQRLEAPQTPCLGQKWRMADLVSIGTQGTWMPKPGDRQMQAVEVELPLRTTADDGY